VENLAAAVEAGGARSLAGPDGDAWRDGLRVARKKRRVMVPALIPYLRNEG